LNETLISIPGGVPAVFRRRPNRFLLLADTASGEEIEVHVPDPGRLKELLYQGNDLLVIPAQGNSRRTNWSLLGARDCTGWILVNTTFHSKIARILFTGPHSPFRSVKTLRAEVTASPGRSRFDFLLNGDLWVEIKGCTLKTGNEARFPDAPTTRGVKHLMELAEMSLRGMKAAVVFLVFVRDVDFFSPNHDADPEFAIALQKAVEAGVAVYPVQLNFDGAEINYTKLLELRFTRFTECF